ncbi:GAP family protein [Nocardioides sp. CFH 31398]|uniref:GAP family protein n=1 Tax=Nocardioides sp. CFH 31398 TaxID=2919579 RepID=UPI001F0619AE|nr:GAP family protein [Nocardioides sp. CFH 31398]MCH1865030.1 GAP family protein [Nocardioides sp. CFH 31398]
MEHVLLGVLPLGLAAAVSPVMLTEQTVLMAGRGGRRRSWAYAVGALLVAAAYVAALVALGRSVSLPALPRLDGAADVLIGLVLLAIAAAVQRWPRRAPRPRKQPAHQHGAGGAFAFGVFSMVTDVTSLALVAAAAKDVAAAGLGGGTTVLLASFLVLLVALPAWLPPALAAAAPGPAARALRAVEGTVRRHSRRIAVVLTAAAGTYLVLRGLLRVVTG